MLELKFVEALRIRCADGRFRSEAGVDLSALQTAFARLAIVDVQPLISVPQDQLEALYRDARARAEEPLDLLSWHLVSLPSGADTAAAIETLRARPEVEYVYLHSNVVPPPPGTF
jgi:hypothetical protein